MNPELRSYETAAPYVDTITPEQLAELRGELYPERSVKLGEAQSYVDAALREGVVSHQIIPGSSLTGEIPKGRELSPADLINFGQKIEKYRQNPIQPE